ncbi:MAG: SusC/RagA family TonB-linked outer membrane protein [Bacteroidales bacterium]|nr:SusC/RagA family TonB-linked outer membrane protein [Bacteroidales bacterium]
MRKIMFLLVFLLLAAGAQVLQAQRTITGTVISAQDRLGVPGATVVVRGTAMGTATDVNGRYTLNVPDDATHLVFSFMGMTPQEVEIGGRTTIDVTLQDDATTLEEFIVTAYGVVRRGTFTGSATTVSSEQLASRSVTNVANALQGNVAGVRMTSGSGQPGEGGDIRIRGFGSINASSEPLIILDGAPVTSSTFAGLNSDDIASMTVLKDAAATALFGSRAANGVIMITTKTGRHDRSGFNVQFTTGIVTRGIREYEMLGPEQSYEMWWLARRNEQIGQGPGVGNIAHIPTFNQIASNDFLTAAGVRYNITNVPDHLIVLPDGRFNPNAQINPFVASDLDWFDPVMRTGSRHTLNVSKSMSNENSDMRASVSYLTEQGYIRNSSFNRLSARLNVNHRVNRWIRTGLNVSAMSSFQESIFTTNLNNENIFASARSMGRVFPVHAHDLSRPWGTCTFIRDANGNKLFDLGMLPATGHHIVAQSIGPDGTPLVRWPQNNNNSIAQHFLDQRHTTRNEYGGRAFVEFSFLENFTFTTNLMHDRRLFSTENMNNQFVGSASGNNGRASTTQTARITTTVNNLLNWNRTFGRHAFTALVGHEAHIRDFDWLYVQKLNAIIPGNPLMTNYTEMLEISGHREEYRLESYLSNVTYSWDERFFGSASWRTDGSSKFHRNSRWGQFWSVGAGWRLDREDFIRRTGIFPYLKLRASFGQIGNDAGISDYAWHARYRIGDRFTNYNEPGTRQWELGAPDLVWESSDNLDIAIEFGTRWGVRGQIEFFNRQSSNLLFDVPMVASSGIPNAVQLMNIGTMFNRGWEFELAYDFRARNGFSWTPSMVLTTFTNRITKLPEEMREEGIRVGNMLMMEGRSIYDFHLREFRGVDPRDGRALYTWDGRPTATLRNIDGEYLTVDHNFAERRYVGSAIPDLIGGLTNTFRWRGFDLSILTTFQIGGYVVDNIYMTMMSLGHLGRPSSFHPDILNSWREPGQVTDIPRLDMGTMVSGQSEATSSRHLTNASFLQLRSINFGYALPQEFVQRMGLSRARAFVVAENLFLLTHRQGMNPTQRFSGVTSAADGFIPSRFFMVGVNVHF